MERKKRSTYTQSRLENGDYEGTYDINGERSGIGSCKWNNGSYFLG
jgi:hypothetical protein